MLRLIWLLFGDRLVPGGQSDRQTIAKASHQTVRGWGMGLGDKTPQNDGVK